MKIETNKRYLDSEGREWLLAGWYGRPLELGLWALGVWNKTHGPGDYLGQRQVCLFSQAGISVEGIALVEEAVEA